MSKIMISELQETTSAPDSSYIAIDNGTTTNKITIANYNSNANATAKRYAEASQGYANDAQTAKNDAVSAKNEAETLANTASSYANAAAASANAAAGSASEASGYVGAAQTSATNAQSSARAAEASAADIDNQVKLAKSWAVGNTGVRADEAVNNSMYWAGQAAAAAGGGVVSFNGRTGSVLPKAGDYSSDQVAHVNSDSTYTNVETALNNAQTDIATAQADIATTQTSINNLGTSKLNKYASDSTQWDTAPTNNSSKPVTSGGVYTALHQMSYVGMIIHSTKFDTEAKVKAFYGGTKWIKHSGYFLRGASSGVVANSATKTGGSDDAVLVSHYHTVARVNMIYGQGSEYAARGLVSTSESASDSRGVTQYAGESGANKNIPNYKAVYIWERTQ